MEPNWGLIVLVVGALMGILGILLAKAKTTRMWLGWIGAGFLILGVVAQVVTVPYLSQPLSSGTSPSSTLSIGDQGTSTGTTSTSTSTSSPSGASTGLCVATDQVTVTLRAQNKQTKAAAGGTHRYQLDNGQWTTIADGGTFIASPQQKLNVLFENASTTANYYSSLESFTVPCKATFDTSSIGGQLSQNGSITVTYFNTNDVAIDGNGANLTLAAGDTPTIKFKVQGQYQREHPYGLVAVVEYNRTSIDDVKILSFAGQQVSSTTVPSADSVSNTGVDRKAYLLPAILGSDFKEGAIYVDADDTVNPGIESDINVRYYSLNYYVDESDASKIKGPAVSDENNALNSLFTLNSTIHTV